MSPIDRVRVVTRDTQDLPPDEAALGWLVLLRDDDATDEDRRRFAQWLAADPTHRHAWAGAERLWHDIAELDRPAMAPHPVAARPVRAGFWPMGLAAGLAMAVCIGWSLTPSGYFADHRAEVGTRQLVRLDDGSSVELGTASALDVNYTAARREVRLVTGEAFFNVTPDPARPFVVQAGAGEVVVRGTAFNVKIASNVQVAVTEHSVEISAGADLSVRVSEGQSARFDDTGVSAVGPADLDTVQAWRRDQLVFIDVPLDSVIAEMGRYRHGYIRLIGGDLGQKRVTAVFDSRRTDDALQVIADSLGLKLYRATDLLIGLTPG